MFKCTNPTTATRLSMIPTIFVAVFAANQSGETKAATPVPVAAPVAVTSPATATSPRSFSVEVIGKGRPVILIPGLMSSPAVWQSTVDALKADHQLHLIHLAGFAGKAARTGVQPDSTLLQSVQQELLAYIAANQLQRPVVIGHSLGGFLAFALASAAPDTIGPMVSVDGLPYLAPVFTRNPATTAAQMQSQAAQISMQYGGMTKAQLSQATAQGLFIQATSPAAQQQVLAMAEQSDPTTVGQVMAELLTTDLRPQVGNIKQPVLLLGASGALPPQAQAGVKALYQQQLEKLPAAQLDINTNARHFIMLDDPAWLNQKIRSFLQEAK
ncbi:MAG: alpha/beta hydrolase [Rheinheimera sp.]|nr:alpha/beta hydrolase [Rheinheimera sp.]